MNFVEARRLGEAVTRVLLDSEQTGEIHVAEELTGRAAFARFRDTLFEGEEGQALLADRPELCAKQVDFDKKTGFAEKWFPYGKQGRVVLDPRVCFGAPTIVRRGVRTANIYDLYHAESRNVGEVASWLSLDSPDIEAAVTFEEALAA